MATNYDRYINSSGTHYISNSGSDENGRLYEGKAGDQTGQEWQLRSWYSRPWTCVLRHPDATVRRMIAEFAIDAALNNAIGYDQYQRYSYWARLQESGYRPANVVTPCEADCTAGVTANVKAIGHLLGLPKLEAIEKDTRSGNMRSRFKAAGFEVLTDSKYLTGYTWLCPGDILLYDNHHAATNVTCGRNAKIQEKTGLRNGDTGENVVQLQKDLISVGYDCGVWGADGDFGDATELALIEFQYDHNLPADGIADAGTLLAMAKAKKALQSDRVRIVNGQCWARTAPKRKDGNELGVCKCGSVWNYGGERRDGYLLIDFNGKNAWVSEKYGVIQR